jgi:hypothetical protein
MLRSIASARLIVKVFVIHYTSYMVSFDAHRNQMARNIDVMLEPSDHKPDATLFCLLTPKVFRERPHARLYGWLFEEYRAKPEAIARDLGHRQRKDWQEVARRLGWLAWEDCAAVVPASCPWLA